MAKTRAQISKDYRERVKKSTGNPDFWKTYGNEWRKENPLSDTQKEQKRKYNTERYNVKKEEINNKRRRENLTPEKLILERHKRQEYYENNPNACIAATYRDRILHALHRQAIDKKCFTSADAIGCSWSDLVKHIESKFANGMTWENYGRGIDKWHVDHIIPCSHFDLTKIEEVKKCFHYTNTQPLWESDNLTKNDKLPQEYIDGKRIWTDEGWKIVQEEIF